MSCQKTFGIFNFSFTIMEFKKTGVVELLGLHNTLLPWGFEDFKSLNFGSQTNL